MIEQVDEAIWLVDGKTVSFHGFPYPTRSVIVRLRNGDLWIWSPIELTPDLRQRVEALGPVRHLVSPNKLHHLYLQDWKAVYPEARLWGPPSTIRKRPELVFHGALGDEPPAEWLPDIGQAWFRGSFAMDEIVFCHRPSATAIVADLIQTFSPEFLREEWGRWSFLARLSGLTRDQGKAPIDLRLSFIDRAPARAARDKVLGWHCERVVVAHGEWIRSNGHAQLAKSFSWLA
ncbi:DUF4336 domain-containing protein [Enhydrobacter sp.]|jgi:hypothetical protein|uniref:DUF4336 domain-containing protein n=1 Tax=Enhydrobacter sp. TaxID=1894999 RepID=UPI002624C251|nr:DUF4336 domain-containing protein [Enhydrobacter sp.]WIM09093.1 MAG: hypothetical protein OJF58_000044 [Enhydrobacter sp.]